MRRKGLWLSLLCVLLCVCAVAGLLAWRGDWRYRLRLAFRRYPAPTPEAVDTSGWEFLSLQALLSDERVSENTHLMLVNNDHPLPADWEPELAIGEGFSMSPAALEAFSALQERVLEETGQTLLLTSAYRSGAEQTFVFAEQGDKIAADPGESEHQTGLALDVCVRGFGGMSFLKTEAGRLTNEICSEFGFVIRYPQGKTNVTGFPYEPWHLRYVGAPHASVMAGANLTMEEYLSVLTPDVWYQSGEYLILRTNRSELPMPSEFISCTVCHDRTGYAIITVKAS